MHQLREVIIHDLGHETVGRIKINPRDLISAPRDCGLSDGWQLGSPLWHKLLETQINVPN